MQLTQDVAARYVGGQMEIQNQGEDYIYRGEIMAITVVGGEVKVDFAWLAKGDSFPPTRWHKDDKPEYAASLEIYAVSNIGNDRISLHSPITGELAILYPPGGSKLDPSKVEGLQLS